jgi:hypothetical protein
MAEHDTQAEPVIVQLGGRFARSAPLLVEGFLHIEHRVTFEHVIDGPGQFVSQDGQGLAILFLQAGQLLLARGIGPQKQDRGFREGPFEIGIANLGARGAIPLTRRVLRTFH